MTTSELSGRAEMARERGRARRAADIGPALPLLMLAVAVSGLLLWFGWWQRDQYFVRPQPAALYEQRPDGSFGNAETGSVTWHLGTSQTDGTTLVAHVVVPDRSLDMTLSIRRNRDDNLPASHLMEVVQNEDENAAGETIDALAMPSVTQRTTSAVRPLLGATAKVGTGAFWAALSPIPQDVRENLALLRRAELLVLPLTYASGRRYLLFNTKGPPGEHMTRAALLAWAR